ncbi:hypothetical protein [Bacillus sp. B-jedd]|uniref:hypothetical protein n=1 Tax=Bacillus sp. B-jedd TaxID=1476857 RepID=UPI000693D522|nr:hypothetical protein [Bacillus sp. B-jedd]
MFENAIQIEYKYYIQKEKRKKNKDRFLSKCDRKLKSSDYLTRKEKDIEIAGKIRDKALDENIQDVLSDGINQLRLI